MASVLTFDTYYYLSVNSMKLFTSMNLFGLRMLNFLFEIGQRYTTEAGSLSFNLSHLASHLICESHTANNEILRAEMDRSTGFK